MDMSAQLWFKHSSWSNVKKHEAHCPAATGPQPLLLKSEHDNDSSFKTVPESAALPASGTEIQASCPDCAHHMQCMLCRHEVTWCSSLVLLIFFSLWHGMHCAGAAVHGHDNNISSVSSSGLRQHGQCRGRHHKSKVSHACTGHPPNQPDYGSDALNED